MHDIQVESDDTGLAFYWREESQIAGIFRILVEWIRTVENVASIETLELRDPEPPGGGGVYLPSVVAHEPGELASLCSRMLRRDFLARGNLLINGVDAGYRLACDGWAVSGLIGLDLPPGGVDQLDAIFDQVADFARNVLQIRLDPTWRREV